MNLNLSGHSWLTWSRPSFFSEWYHGTLISYQLYIVNQNGVLLYNNVTIDTLFELYNNNFLICDVYTATVVAYGEPYKSLDATTSVQIIEGKKIQQFELMIFLQSALLTFSITQ